MGEPLDPARRPSRLPLFIHVLVVLLLSLSVISGLLVWRAQFIQEEATESPVWLHAALVLHGVLNPFLCVLFGYLCCQHIRFGWRLRANLLTGFTMELIFGGLILSGIGLYYAGAAEWRNLCVQTHRILGLLLAPGLGMHWVAGLRWAKKVQLNPCS
jgi:hypothetical protein